MANNTELTIMSDAEHEAFLNQHITITRREFDEVVDRAREHGLQTGMMIGRINAEFKAESEKLAAVIKATDSIANRLKLSFVGETA